jgi:hypothetical protein
VWWTALLLLHVVWVGDASPIADLARRWSIEPKVLLAIFPFVVGLALACLVLVVVAMGRAMRIDPGGWAASALAWGARAPGMRGWLLVAVCVPVSLVTYAGAQQLIFYAIEHGGRDSATVGVVTNMFLMGNSSSWLEALLGAVAAFTGSRRGALANRASAWRPRLAWPGPGVVALSLVFAGLSAALGYLNVLALIEIGAVVAAIVFECVFLLAMVVFGSWATALLAGAWVERSSGGETIGAVLRHATRWRVIGTYLALGARWAGWALFPLGLVLLDQMARSKGGGLGEVATEAIDALGVFDPFCVMRLDLDPIALAMGFLAFPIALSGHRLWVQMWPPPERAEATAAIIG